VSGDQRSRVHVGVSLAEPWAPPVFVVGVSRHHPPRDVDLCERQACVSCAVRQALASVTAKSYT
jgi:hypothetical protein